MKKFAAVILVVLLSIGVAFANSYYVKKKAGDYSAELAMNKGAVKGKNDLEITVKDPESNYVTDAKIIVNYCMPARSGCLP